MPDSFQGVQGGWDKIAPSLTGISGAVSGNATDGEHLVKHCFSNSASGKNIRVGNTEIKRSNDEHLK